MSAYRQDECRATSQIVRRFSAVDSLTALMVRDEAGKFMGTLNLRMMRPEEPSAFPLRILIASLADVEETI